MRELRRRGYANLLAAHAAPNSTCATRRPSPAFFAAERPEYVFIAAAKVGGIHANDAYPADFIRDNLLIQTNVIDAAYRSGDAEALLPRLELHLSAAGAAADARGHRC